MSNLDRLHERFRKTPAIQNLAEQLQTSTKGFHLQGLAGAELCFVLTALLQENRRWNHMVIAQDKEDAAYIQNTLASINPDTIPYFFPDSFKNPLQFDAVYQTNVLSRTEVINQLAGALNGQIMVTYPEALFEKVVNPAVLKDSKIEMRKGDQLHLDQLIQTLVKNNFERVDFVYEPGQFSIRGAIVDIFSYGHEKPYRIELFDEDIESIRIFDPVTQLSERSLALLNLVPNLNRTYIATDKIPLLEALPENYIVWVSDLQFILERVQISFEKLVAYAKYSTAEKEEEIYTLYHDRNFLYPNEVIRALETLKTVYYGPKPDLSALVPIAFQAKAQPSFNKNFALLIRAMKELQDQRYELFLFTDNTKQIERFYRIFEDLDASIQFHPIPVSVHAGFIDEGLKVACFTDHQIFERFHRYSIRKGFSQDQSLKLRMLQELEPGDYVTHIDYGVGRYSGLEILTVNGRQQESVRLIYKNNDILYVSINALHKISKYTGKEGTEPQLSRLGSDAWAAIKRKTKRKIKDIAKDLIKLYAQRKAAKGYKFPPDGYLQAELEASFIYEDTPDQYQATVDVKKDMQQPHPMDRLICGDVGFGKTEVAIRAAFKCVAEGRQVAVLVPTTILALQHYQTFSERLKEFGIRVDYVNRFRTAKQKKDILEQLKAGQVEIIIGTHALLGKDVQFKDLGLLVIDEEQKFGVAAKERLRNLRVNVDTLTLTATPIPRTLQFSLMAARDLSIIRTPPPNRQPIHTERRIFSDDFIREALYFEVNRGGQVFFVHNRVKNLIDVATMLRTMCPDIRIQIAHGQMEPGPLENTLMDYINKKIDVLVSTNIIETGLDIPNANTIIINNAHQFGLSDLHQLRGRVGRSNTKAYCYLLCPPLSILTADARKRLQTLEEFSELGSGFEIAMRDLDIRGAGNLLGAEQSGFIAEIGYETYHKILDEAIQELKESEFKDVFQEELQENRVFVKEVQIETDTEMLMPDTYVSNVQERLRLYTELDQVETEEGIVAFRQSLADRFGPVPRQVEEIFEGLRLRWLCRQMGFEQLSLKNQKLRAYFTSNEHSPFYQSEYFQQFLKYIAAFSLAKKLTLKQSNNHLILIREGVTSLQQVRDLLQDIYREVNFIAQSK